ncbi:MAG: sugar phosphate isomerase/epimerase [Gemmataceae bacterium]|nr:sugar phosphate isomerase/epimerase [Gemmataceae bacterium]
MSFSTRRQFLASTAGVGAAAVASSAVASSAVASSAFADPPARNNNDFGGFTVGIQTYTFRNFNLEQTLTRIKDLGIRYAEFYRGHIPTTSNDDQIKAAKDLCAKYDVTPIAFGVESFGKDEAPNRRIFDFAKKLGVRYLSADPSPDSFDTLDKLAAEFEIAIAIHPHGPTGNALHRWYSAEVINQAVRNHHRLIGTCLDTGHLIRSAQAPHNRKLDPAQQIRAMGPRNFGLHLKDHDNERRVDVVYGRGVLDVPGILTALREVKFTGYISIEYEANPNNPSPDVAACLDVFKQAIRKMP